jgi:hypothetical protein
MSCIHEETLRYIEESGVRHPKRSKEERNQKNRSQIRKSRRKPTPANGPYYDTSEGVISGNLPGGVETAYLLDQQLPVDANCGFLIPFTVLPQTPR